MSFSPPLFILYIFQFQKQHFPQQKNIKLLFILDMVTILHLYYQHNQHC